MKIFKVKNNDIYYNLSDIDNTGALFRLVIGQRSNGKTYAVLKKILTHYIKKKTASAYIRRYAEDIRPANIKNLLSPHINLIRKLTRGKFNNFILKSNCFYLCYIPENSKTGKPEKIDPTPCLYLISLSQWEHTKGADRGQLDYLVFDEFCTRAKYLENEFIIFSNVISSLIRNREPQAIYMLANTVNKYCPYFEEMGLYNIEDIKQGEIYLYDYNDEKTQVAVEYSRQAGATDTVSKFFAFENPQLDMIKNGAWEEANYRHLEKRYTKDDIYFTFYLQFTNHILKANVYKVNKDLCILFFRCTNLPSITDSDTLYTDRPTTCLNHVNSFLICNTKKQELIKNIIMQNKDYYSSNSVGEIVNNFKKEGIRLAI